MKVNSNPNGYAASYTGLKDGMVISNLCVTESVFFTLVNGVVEATKFSIICDRTFEQTIKSFIDSLASKNYTNLDDAKKQLPVFENIPVGFFLKSYEHQTETGVKTLYHQGSFSLEFKKELEPLMKVVDGRKYYDVAAATTALTKVLAKCPTQSLICSKQTSIKNKRGSWMPFFDFNMN